jgi:hypothetical protein
VITTTDIARNHGYTGPIVCEDCGTTENLHFGSWFDPKTQESGDFLQCCACGIKAGDPADIHDACEPTADEPDEADTDEGPTVRVFHRPSGWVLPDFTDLADCTTNFHREQDGRPACTDTAVWKVVEDHGLHLTIGFYCDADLPAETRQLTGEAA